MSERKPKRKPQPVYMGWRSLIDPQTNQPRMALVAIDAVSAQQLKERGYRAGDRVRCEISQSRHYGNHKFVHLLGGLVRDQLTGFENCNSNHDAVKKLQQDSEICCDITMTHVPGIGQLRSVQARSISFDSMTEEEFRLFRTGICEHIRTTYWPSLTANQISEMIESTDGQQAA